jgi:hypothetical protein
MKNEDLFSHNEPPPTASDHDRGGDSNRSAISQAYPVPQGAPPPVHAPKTERRLTPRHPLRLLLVVMVVLVALAGGYSVFHAVTPPSRQASSAFQQVHCPFTLGRVSSRGRMSGVASWWCLKTIANRRVPPFG